MSLAASAARRLSGQTALICEEEKLKFDIKIMAKKSSLSVWLQSVPLHSALHASNIGTGPGRLRGKDC